MIQRLFVFSFFTAAMLFSLSSGCNSPDENKSNKLKVVCTTGMVADLVQNVAGDLVEVKTIMQAGVDPHLYQPAIGDMKLLTEADIVFYNGLNLEGKMTDVLIKLARNKPVYSVASYIREKQSKKILEDDQQHFDPHLWFDVKLWSQGVDLIADVLAKQDSENADTYKNNAKEYKNKLLALDAECAKKIQSIPKQQRVLITAHDAFQYFGKRYGITVKAIQGISTDSQASIKHINDLVDYIVKNKIKAIFVESTVPRDYVQAVIEGCKNHRDTPHTLRIGGELYSDAMGEKPPTNTYIGMVQHNVDTIVKALK